ncbi:MAG: GNAT family N-acetyltransferase [Sumerlaeia bacterium]
MANADALVIRPAVPDDVPMIRKMIHELAVYERAAEEDHATEEALARHLFGPTPRAEVLIAEYNGQVAAFALFCHNFSTWEAAPGLWLEDLFVRPAYRRRGIGKAIFHRLGQIAVERGCARFEFTVLDWNKPALDFYATLGAVGLVDWTTHRITGEALEALARGGE